MQLVQELEKEGIVNPQERDGLLLGFLEHIERLNKHIAWHQSFDDPSESSVREFSDLRDDYIEQVRLLMNYYGLDVKLLLSPPTASQRAA